MEEKQLIIQELNKIFLEIEKYDNDKEYIKILKTKLETTKDKYKAILYFYNGITEFDKHLNDEKELNISDLVDGTISFVEFLSLPPITYLDDEYGLEKLNSFRTYLGSTKIKNDIDNSEFLKYAGDER